MVIDFHTHIFPDKLAPRAYEVLSINAKAAGYKPIHKLTKAELIAKMDESGVDLSVVCPVATKPTQSEKNLEWGVSINDDRIVTIAGLFPDKESWRKNVDSALSMGYKGIKLHPEYQNFILDSDEMLPLYDYAFSKDMFILFHAGFDPIGKEPFKSNPQMFLHLVEEFKGAKIVAAHFGGHAQWDDVETYLAGKDIYLDTSMGFEYFGKEKFLSILAKHGARKILFGSDSPWSNTAGELATLKGLPISDADKDMILYKNACKLLEIQ
ncbi:MAG: amidohydrolase family protein [Clostridia bacterium]|nr:amidohydrolase family protein [Clostridia bacterium]